MKKILIALVGLAMLAGVSAFATSTRTLVMGDNNMIMVDDYNMFMYPGRVNNYPNLVLGEFGSSAVPFSNIYSGNEFYNFGVTWLFNEENPWVLGTFVSTYPLYFPMNYFGDDIADFDSDYEDFATPRRMQLVYGRKLGGQNFGFNLEAVKASHKIEEQDNNPKESYYQYTFGLGLTEGTTGKWDVGLSFMKGGWTNEDPDGEKITEPSGYYDLGLSGRYFWVRNPKITLVPHAQVMLSKRGSEHFEAVADATDNWKEEYSMTSFGAGFGMNYAPAPNILGVADFGFSYSTIKSEFTAGATAPVTDSEEKESLVVFPYLKLGFEGEVFSWMDVRAGGYTTLWSSSEKFEDVTGDFTETWNLPFSATFLGVGLHWGKLYLDTYMDPQIVLDGFNFISGSSDADDLNFQVSMLYEMF